MATRLIFGGKGRIHPSSEFFAPQTSPPSTDAKYGVWHTIVDDGKLTAEGRRRYGSLANILSQCVSYKEHAPQPRFTEEDMLSVISGRPSRNKIKEK